MKFVCNTQNFSEICSNVQRSVSNKSTIPAIEGILITAADMLYFFALKDDGALLSVVSLLRRSSTIVTFVLGALIFRERRIGTKAAVLALMLCGVVLLALSSL